MRGQARSLRPQGLDLLFEVVDGAASCPGHALRAEMLRAEKATHGLTMSDVARAVRVPAPALAEVMSGKRAWRTPEAYGVAVDRIRSAARHRREVAAGTLQSRRRPWPA